jgi:PAS domain S-box-containing protein
MHHLRKLFELSADMLCIAGTDGYFKEVSPSVTRILGFSSEELRGAPFIDFVHPDDRAATLAEMGALGRGAPTLRFENRYRCKDGSYKWLAWTSVPNLDEQLLYAVARDVTDVKTELEHLMNDLPGMVYRGRNDRARTMEFVSAGCRSLTGIRAAGAAGQPARRVRRSRS